MSGPPDIALVSLGTTPGLERSDAAFAALVGRAGLACEVVRAVVFSTTTRWLELVGRARVFVDASRWEDFGIAPMEALRDLLRPYREEAVLATLRERVLPVLLP